MRAITLITSLITLGLFIASMFAALYTMRGDWAFVTYLKIAIAALLALMFSQAFALMFVFKMHGIIHMLMAKLDREQGSV